MVGGMAATNHFDPYHKWLGIPADEQPPNHYRLLGIRVFETDPDVIQSAADQRMAHVRTFQIGANAELSQKLLNELAAARVCLLKSERKATYDAELKRKLATKPTPKAASSPSAANSASAAAGPPKGIPVAAPVRAATTAANHGGIDLDLGMDPPTYRRRRKKQTDHAPLIMAGVIGTLIVGGLIVSLTLMRGKSEPARPIVARTTPPPPVETPHRDENKPVAETTPKPASPDSTPPKPASPEPTVPEPTSPKGTPADPSAPVITEPPQAPVSSPPKVEVATPAEPPRTARLRNIPSLIDDQDPIGFRVTGERWWTQTRAGASINDGRHIHRPGTGQAEAIWTFDGLEPGKKYTVLATWMPHKVNATNATYWITSIADVNQSAYADQSKSPRADLVVSGFPFEALAMVTANSDTITVRLTDRADNDNHYIVADAVLLIAGTNPQPGGVVIHVPRVQPSIPQSAPNSVPRNVPQQQVSKPPATTQRIARHRHPVPTEEAQKEIRSLLHEVFAEDFRKATTRAAKGELSQRLLAQAHKSKDNVERYVLLNEVRKLDAETGKAGSAIVIVRQLANRYELDLWDALVAQMDELATVATSDAAREELIDAIQVEVDRAIGMEEYDAALRMLTVGREVAKKTGDAFLINGITGRRKTVEEQAKAFAAASGAKQALEAAPDDRDAELALGKYLCFIRRDWANGPTHLAKGSDSRLAEIAALEHEKPTAPDDQLKLADQWSALAEHSEGLARASMLDRAVFWYRQATGRLSGLAQTKAQQQLDKVTALLAEASPDVQDAANIPESKALAKIIKTAIKTNNLTRTSVFGVASGPQYAFAEVPPAGMLMVGMNYAVKPGSRVMAVQPIYAGVKETIRGRWYGGDARLGVTGQALAPAGYAVGGLKTVSPDYLFGFEIIYMKITRNGLDRSDTKLSPLIGVDKPEMTKYFLGGDGRPVVGMFGSMTQQAYLEGFGLIQIGK
jgi:hypothetical protein